MAENSSLPRAGGALLSGPVERSASFKTGLGAKCFPFCCVGWRESLGPKRFVLMIQMGRLTRGRRRFCRLQNGEALPPLSPRWKNLALGVAALPQGVRRAASSRSKRFPAEALHFLPSFSFCGDRSATRPGSPASQPAPPFQRSASARAPRTGERFGSANRQEALGLLAGFPARSASLETTGGKEALRSAGARLQHWR